MQIDKTCTPGRVTRLGHWKPTRGTTLQGRAVRKGWWAEVGLRVTENWGRVFLAESTGTGRREEAELMQK